MLASRPVLWVGAGLSIAAGYPSAAELEAAIREDADVPIAEDLGLPEVADAYIEANNRGPLNRLLHRLIGRVVVEPTLVHRAIAQLAGGERDAFAAIVDTNHDRLLERALEDAGVVHVVQKLEENAEIGADDLRVIKLHGSAEDWRTTILSGAAHRAFDTQYSFLLRQLDVLLTQRPLLFVGCSLRQPRLLQWLGSRDPDTLERLDRWRPLMTQATWERALVQPWGTGTAAEVWARGSVRPLIVRDRAHLVELWKEVSGYREPARQPAPAPASRPAAGGIHIGGSVGGDLVLGSGNIRIGQVQSGATVTIRQGASGIRSSGADVGAGREDDGEER